MVWAHIMHSIYLHERRLLIGKLLDKYIFYILIPSFKRTLTFIITADWARFRRKKQCLSKVPHTSKKSNVIYICKVNSILKIALLVSCDRVRERVETCQANLMIEIYKKIKYTVLNQQEACFRLRSSRIIGSYSCSETVKPTISNVL